MPLQMEKIGPCALYCGDCLEIIPQLEAGTVDVVITDPPYGTTLLEWDKKINFSGVWRGLQGLCKKQCTCLFFSAFSTAADIIESASIPFRYELVWQKQKYTGFLDARRRPLRAHEFVLVFQLGGVYNPIKKYVGTSSLRIGKEREYVPHYNKFNALVRGSSDGTRFPLSVFFEQYEADFFKKNDYPFHPTQKPVTVMKYLVKTFSDLGMLILDPFMGNGSTGVACIETGREFVGIELSPEYFDTACQRIENALRNQQNRLPIVENE